METTNQRVAFPSQMTSATQFVVNPTNKNATGLFYIL